MREAEEKRLEQALDTMERRLIEQLRREILETKRFVGLNLMSKDEEES